MSGNGMGKPRLRDRRQARHLWVDNEVLDVFGPEIGQNGISVYTTLARYCYANGDVRMSLRELAEKAFMKKDTVARAMKALVAIGLVVETRPQTMKAASSYALADVKELVRVREESMRRHDLSCSETDSSVDKNFCRSQSATDLSHGDAGFETDLSQNAGLSLINKTKDSKDRRQLLPPSPRGGASGWELLAGQPRVGEGG